MLSYIMQINLWVTNMYFENKRTGKMMECPPYKCKVCGLSDIEYSYQVCRFCGWEDDDIQNDYPNYIGGANKMSLNQYKKFWEENKDVLQSEPNIFLAIELSEKYYQTHFKKENEELLKREQDIE